MPVNLKLFDTQLEAREAADRSKAGVIYPMPLGKKVYLKKAGEPGIEPKFLCTDSRWRRYDLIPELPGSSAAEPG